MSNLKKAIRKVASTRESENLNNMASTLFENNTFVNELPLHTILTDKEFLSAQKKHDAETLDFIQNLLDVFINSLH